MLFTFLLILLIADSILLMAVILLQAGKGGGVAAAFGGASSSADALFGSRQAGNLLTRTSWWGGGVFLALAFMLSLISTSANRPASVLENQYNPQAAPTAPSCLASVLGVPLANGNIWSICCRMRPCFPV